MKGWFKLKITARIKKIIFILLDQQDYITAQDIAENLSVSTRTILRELDNVEKCLEKKNIALEKKKGIGIKINLNSNKVQDIKDWLSNIKTELTDSPDQRYTVIKAELLKEQAPTKLFNLSHKLNVTESTISNDLDSIESWFEKFDLLLIRKPGFGVYIKGSEESLRRAIVALLYESFHEIELINFILQYEGEEILKTKLSKIDKVVIELMEIRVVPLIREFFRDFESNIGYQLADNSYIALIIRFIVTLNRIDQNLMITIDDELKKRLKHEKIFLLLKKWVNKSDNEKIKKLNEDELCYLTMHIKGAKLRETNKDNSISMIEDYKMIRIAKKIIRIAEYHTHSYLEDNEKLLNGLVRHLGPAINRIRLKLDIMNPLLKDIKEMYPYLYNVAEECAKVIEEEEGIHVPEDEVAYIATHIGSALKSEHRRSNNKYRVVIACGNGIGTSQLLAAEIEKEFHNLDIVSIISTFETDIEKLENLNVDLMISTVPVPNFSLPSIQVNSILTNQDKLNIKNFLDSFIPKPHKGKSLSFESLKDKLNRLKQYCETILEVASHFNLYEDAEISNLTELIHFVSSKIVSSADAMSELEKAFRDREEKGSTVLGQKDMMLLHTRSNAVDELYFIVVRGKDKIPIYNSKNTLVYLETIVVMVAPIILKGIELEVLSEISRMIITSEFSDILKNGNKEEIFMKLSSILDQFIQTKVIVTE